MSSFYAIELALSDQQIASLDKHYADLLANLEHKPFLTPKMLDKLRLVMRTALESQPSFAEIYQQAKHTHTVLHLIHRDNRLLNLPWRLAVEERERLSLTCGVQGIKQKQAFQAQAASPLKILVMVSAPEDLNRTGRLDYESEEQQIIQAFGELFTNGQVQIDFTDDGSLEGLQSKLQANHYHILHFSGHGVFDEEGRMGHQTAHTGYLLLEDEENLKQKLIPARDFAHALREGGPNLPDLVLLSSCQTAQGSRTSEGFRGVANKLLEAGVPAVVAMGFSILDKFATDFATEFYRQLGNRVELCQSFQAALGHIKALELPYAQQENRLPSQWMIPQLYLRQQVDQLVNWTAPHQRLRFKSLKLATGEQRLLLEAQDGYLFIGRRRERRDALRHLNGQGKAVLLRGMGGVGKTALAEHLLGRLAANDPKLKPFVVNEKEYSTLEALLVQMQDYLQKEQKQFLIRSEVEEIETAEDQLNFLLAQVKRFANPVFLCDNLESFQDGPTEKFKEEHSDILECLKWIILRKDCPVILTSRYPLQEFPDLPQVDLNGVRYGDFFKKCLQLSFASLQTQSHTYRRIKPKQSFSFDGLVHLLHETIGGNYRALEAFDTLFQEKIDKIVPTLARLETFQQKLKKEHAPAILDKLQSGAKDLILEELYALLNEEERQVLHKLSGFRVPIFEMALRMQGLKGHLHAHLTRLSQLTLAESQGTGAQQTFYVPPLVQDFLARQALAVNFDHRKAGKYFQHLAEKVSQLSVDAEEAFWHYLQAEAKTEVNELGTRLCQLYYQKQVFAKSLFYGKATEDLLQAETSDSIWNVLGLIHDLLGQRELAEHYQKLNLNDDQQQGNREGEAITLNNLATSAHAQGDYDQALRYLHDSLQIQREMGNHRGMAQCMTNIGSIALEQGNFSEALQHFERSLEIFQKIKDRQGEGTVLNNIGQIQMVRGDLATALRYLDDSLRISEEIGDYQGQGTTLNNLASIAKALGDYDKALRHLENSLKIRQKIGDRQGEGQCLVNLSGIAYSQGDHDKALRYTQKSLQIQREIGDRKGAATSLNNLGEIFRVQGNNEQALPYLKESLRIRQEIGDRRGEGATLNNLAIIALGQKDFDEAMHFFQGSLEVLKEIGDQRGEGVALANISKIYETHGNYDKALDALTDSLLISDEIGDLEGMAHALNNMGSIYLNPKKQPEVALPYFMRAYAILTQIGSPNIWRPENFINIIINQIGSARFNAIAKEWGISLRSDQNIPPSAPPPTPTDPPKSPWWQRIFGKK